MNEATAKTLTVRLAVVTLLFLAIAAGVMVAVFKQVRENEQATIDNRAVGCAILRSDLPPQEYGRFTACQKPQIVERLPR